jgi:hypothetical protein
MGDKRKREDFSQTMHRVVDEAATRSERDETPLVGEWRLTPVVMTPEQRSRVAKVIHEVPITAHPSV